MATLGGDSDDGIRYGSAPRGEVSDCPLLRRTWAALVSAMDGGRLALFAESEAVRPVFWTAISSMETDELVSLSGELDRGGHGQTLLAHDVAFELDTRRSHP